MAVELKTEWGIRFTNGAIADNFGTRNAARMYLRDATEYDRKHGIPPITGSVVKRSLRIQVGEWEKA